MKRRFVRYNHRTGQVEIYEVEKPDGSTWWLEDAWRKWHRQDDWTMTRLPWVSEKKEE